MSNTRKVLYSPGFGAGWYSWNTDFPALATDPILVEMVEKGEHIDDKWRVTDKFIERATEICGGQMPYAGGVSMLKIIEVNGRFRIEEYDGSERVITDSTEGWL